MKDWKAILLLIIMPVFFISLFAYTLYPYINENTFVEPFDIIVVDSEDTAQTRMLIKQIEELDIFRNVFTEDRQSAISKMEQDLVPAVIILPENFTASVSVGENKPVKVIGNRNMPLKSFIVKTFVQSTSNIVSAGQSAINSIYHFNEKAKIPANELKKEYADSTSHFILEALSRGKIYNRAETSAGMNLTSFEYFTASLIVIFLMFAGMPGLKMLVTERELGVFKRLRVSPAKTWAMLFSKITVTFLLSTLQFLIIIVLTLVLFNNYWGANIKDILLLFGATLFSVSCWSILVSFISRSAKSADVIGNLGILLMAVVGGSIYPLTSMPGFIRVLSKFTINYWAMEGFMIVFSGNKALHTSSSALVLAVLGLAMLSLAFLKYCWKIKRS